MFDGNTIPLPQFKHPDAPEMASLDCPGSHNEVMEQIRKAKKQKVAEDLLLQAAKNKQKIKTRKAEDLEVEQQILIEDKLIAEAMKKAEQDEVLLKQKLNAKALIEQTNMKYTEREVDGMFA